MSAPSASTAHSEGRKGTWLPEPGLRRVPEHGDAGEVWSSDNSAESGLLKPEGLAPRPLVDCGLGCYCCF